MQDPAVKLKEHDSNAKSDFLPYDPFYTHTTILLKSMWT